MKYHLNIRITFSLWVWSDTGICCPEGYGLHPQRVSKPNRTWCEQPVPVDIYDNYDIYDHQGYTHKLICHIQNNLPILFNSPWSQRHTNLHTFKFPSMCFHKHLHQGQLCRYQKPQAPGVSHTEAVTGFTNFTLCSASSLLASLVGTLCHLVDTFFLPLSKNNYSTALHSTAYQLGGHQRHRLQPTDGLIWGMSYIYPGLCSYGALRHLLSS